MDVIQILKIAFTVMLCVPVAYIAYILLEQLLDQVAATSGTKKSGRTRRKARKDRQARKR